MHLCTRIALLVTIVSIVKCSAVADVSPHETEREGKSISPDHEGHLEGEEISLKYETDREGRRVYKNQEARLNFGIIDSLIGKIDFEMGNCSTGTCMSQKDCVTMNGTYSGDRCVNGYGVCCVIDPNAGYVGGDTTITGEGGDFLNPGTTVVTRQAIVETVTYTATVIPAADDVQIKVLIREMNIQGPVEGDCGNDSLTITGTNPGPEIPILCGVVTNQILYLDVDNTNGPILFEMFITINNTIDQTWNISISFLKAADSVERRCLQYYTATSGTIESFNYGQMINDQTYSICFAYVVGYCNIGFTFSRLDLGNVDGSCESNYLLIEDNQWCGDSEEYQITANATGPINVGVRSGAMNELEEEGFQATYRMMGC